MTASTIFNWSGHALLPAFRPAALIMSRFARPNRDPAYATLPNLIKVGLLFNLWGEGQLGSIVGGLGGAGVSTFDGLMGK